MDEAQPSSRQVAVVGSQTQTADESIDDLPTLLATIGIPVDAPAADHSATIVPPQAGPQTHDQTALGALPRIVLADDQGDAELRLGETIGSGGMGVIRSAVQVPLDRDVAVKSVRPDRTAPEATLALLREAWITGSLEHPNVVPVHTLGRDANGPGNGVRYFLFPFTVPVIQAPSSCLSRNELAQLVSCSSRPSRLSTRWIRLLMVA